MSDESSYETPEPQTDESDQSQSQSQGQAQEQGGNTEAWAERAGKHGEREKLAQRVPMDPHAKQGE